MIMSVHLVLGLHWQAYMQKRNGFSQRPNLTIKVYSGELTVNTASELQNLLKFQIPLEQQTNEVTAYPANDKSTVLTKCRQLFNDVMSSAIHIIFY